MNWGELPEGVLSGLSGLSNTSGRCQAHGSAESRFSVSCRGRFPQGRGAGLARPSAVAGRRAGNEDLAAVQGAGDAGPARQAASSPVCSEAPGPAKQAARSSVRSPSPPLARDKAAGRPVTMELRRPWRPPPPTERRTGVCISDGHLSGVSSDICSVHAQGSCAPLFDSSTIRCGTSRPARTP